MSEVAEPKPQSSRSRPSRDSVEAGARQRRRRTSQDDEGVDYNLWVDESRLDRANYQYRWVNDIRGRVRKLEAQDWDIVSEQEVGFPTDRHGDIAHGKSEDLRMKLMKKPKDWYVEDHARKQSSIDERMKAAARGEPMQEKGAGGESLGGLAPEHAYKPKAANEGLTR